LTALLPGMLALLLGVLTLGSPFAGQVSAQASPALLTTVAPDGALRVLDGNVWTVLSPNLGKGAAVTGLAWHPNRPEVLVVRRSMNGAELSYSLVYIDLATGREQTILEGVGPQAEIVGPQIAPDGRSGFARLECCLSREIVRFALPLTSEPPKQGPAGGFLSPEAREVSLMTTGAYAPDGRLLMTADCCMGDDPPPDPRGLYRVSADLTTGEKIASAVQGLPIGVGPGGAWVAVLTPTPPSEYTPMGSHSLALVDLPGGKPRLLMGEGGMHLAQAGSVAPDGRIVVAALPPGDELWQPYTSLFVFTSQSAISLVPEHDGGGVTAFRVGQPGECDGCPQGRTRQASDSLPDAQFEGSERRLPP
jgi:hypothetical protein